MVQQARKLWQQHGPVGYFLAQTPNPTDDEIDASLTNICRCGTYLRIKAGIKRAAEMAVATSASAKEPLAVNKEGAR